jgi:hypothetical protein
MEKNTKIKVVDVAKLTPKERIVSTPGSDTHYLVSEDEVRNMMARKAFSFG